MEELNYNLISKNVPTILEQDWGMVFNNLDEKEIAIKIFEWKYVPQDSYADMSIDSWQINSLVKFNKGYFNGKISFSLNKEKISIIKIMIAIVSFIIRDKEDPMTYVGTAMSLNDVFKSAMNVHMIKDDVQRCIFLKMIEISKNNPHISIPLFKIDEMCDSKGECNCWSDFNCQYKKEFECGCVVKENNFREALKALQDMHVIRLENNAYYIS